jgi:hypothetical protein
VLGDKGFQNRAPQTGRESSVSVRWDYRGTRTSRPRATCSAVLHAACGVAPARAVSLPLLSGYEVGAGPILAMLPVV